MTTYQKGREPAGAPVTLSVMIDGIEFRRWKRSWARKDGVYWRPMPRIWARVLESHERLAHAAAEWRKLAESARGILIGLDGSGRKPLIGDGLDWCARFDAMKETFGD